MRTTGRLLRSLVLTGLVAASSVAAASADNTLRRPIDAEPETLDPQKTTSADDFAIDSDLFEPLVGRDADQHLVPGAALSWDLSADGLTYLFHLRPDGRWSNGDPVTAADFVYAFRRLVTPATGAADIAPVRHVVGAVAINAGREKDVTKLGVRAVDKLTLAIDLTQREVALPAMLAGGLRHAAASRIDRAGGRILDPSRQARRERSLSAGRLGPERPAHGPSQPVFP